MRFSRFVVLAVELVTVASSSHAPFARSNETTPIASAACHLSSTVTTTFSLSPTAAASGSSTTTTTLEPMKAGVSYADTTSIVSIDYIPSGTMTTLMVAPGEPSAEATVPRAGFRTSTSTTTAPVLTSATPTPSTTIVADSAASVSHMTPRGLLWGCLVIASLGYGSSILLM